LQPRGYRPTLSGRTPAQAVSRRYEARSLSKLGSTRAALLNMTIHARLSF